MSLTTHLDDSSSPVTEFMHSRFHGIREFLKHPRKQVRESSTQIKPIVGQGPSGYPYGPIGTAIDYRIRYYFAVCSPDALLPSRSLKELPIEDTSRFSQGLSALTDLLDLPGRRLAAQDEDELNVYCIALGFLDALSRGFAKPSTIDYKSATELLVRVQKHHLDDMRELSWTFYEKCQHVLSRPHRLNPFFEGSTDVGGADADLIVEGTLIEIKTTTSSKIITNWLWQLLGYVLLDYSNQHGIDAIALYMARQGLLLRWDLEEAIQRLCGDRTPSIEELRAEFREAVHSI